MTEKSMSDDVYNEVFSVRICLSVISNYENILMILYQNITAKLTAAACSC